MSSMNSSKSKKSKNDTPSIINQRKFSLKSGLSKESIESSDTSLSSFKKRQLARAQTSETVLVSSKDKKPTLLEQPKQSGLKRMETLKEESILDSSMSSSKPS